MGNFLAFAHNLLTFLEIYDILYSINFLGGWNMPKPKVKEIDLKSVGGRIRKARTGASLTMKELSERLGVSFAYLGMVERGERNPSDKILAAIAEATGTPVDWLKNGDKDSADDELKKIDSLQSPLNIDAALFLGLIMREEPSISGETIAAILGVDQDNLKNILDGTLKFDPAWETPFSILAQRSKIPGILDKLRAVESFLEREDAKKNDIALIRTIQSSLSEKFRDEFTYSVSYRGQENYVDIKSSLRNTGYPVRQFDFMQKATASSWYVTLYSELSGPTLEHLIGITIDPEDNFTNKNEAIVFIKEENFLEALSYAKELIRGSDKFPKVAVMLLDPDSMRVTDCREI